MYMWAIYRKSSNKPPGGLFISNTGGGEGEGRGCLIETVAYVRAGLFVLAETMVSIPQKEPK